MGTIIRNIKEGGTSAIQDGTLIDATDVNNDMDTLFSELNGNVDTVNLGTGAVTDAKVSASAAIDPTKIDDQSADDPEQVVATTPGTSDNQTRPTSLAGELQTLRYGLERIGLGIDASRRDGAAKTANWIDLPARGRNHVYNGAFVQTESGSTNPHGWALSGTPSTVATLGADVSEGEGNWLHVIAAAASDGISQTLAGLKASTLYLVTLRVKVTVGTVTVATTGADAASEFQNMAEAVTSATTVTVKGVIQTDSTPTDIVLLITGSANLDEWEMTHVEVRECNTDPWDRPGVVVVQQQDTGTGDTFTFNVWAANSTLSIAVTPPGPNYVISVSGYMSGTSGTVSSVSSLRLAIAENGTRIPNMGVKGAAISSTAIGVTSSVEYVNAQPVAGTTYTYTIEGLVDGTAGDTYTSNGASDSRLTVRMEPC